MEWNGMKWMIPFLSQEIFDFVLFPSNLSLFPSFWCNNCLLDVNYQANHKKSSISLYITHCLWIKQLITHCLPITTLLFTSLAIYSSSRLFLSIMDLLALALVQLLTWAWITTSFAKRDIRLNTLTLRCSCQVYMIHYWF